MTFRPNRDAGRSAVALLATAVVLLFGAAACALLILTVAEKPGWPLAGAAAMFVFLSVTLFTWGGRTERPRQRQSLLAWLRGRQTTDPLKDYQPRVRRPVAQQFGTNAPPSVETAREAADDFARWVPKSTAEECHRPAGSPRRRR
jgi:hypothetical protein